MKILITGVSGFIGSRLLKAVCARYGAQNVVVLSSKANAECDYIKYNDDYSIASEDMDKLSQVELLIHAGAYIPKNRFDSNNIIGCNSNISFTDILLELPFLKLKKVIYLSTIDVYGDAEIISESSVLDPASLYGLSKLYCEKMIISFCDSLKIQSQILRIGHVYGPGEEQYEKLLPIAIKNMLNNREIELWGDGSELRSFIYIKDVIDACLVSIGLPENTGVINIVSGQPISIANLLDKLAVISGKELVLIRKPYTGKKRNLLFDNSKMITHLIKNETSLDEGLKDEIMYVKALS